MPDAVSRVRTGDHVGQVDNTNVPRFAGPPTLGVAASHVAYELLSAMAPRDRS